MEKLSKSKSSSSSSGDQQCDQETSPNPFYETKIRSPSPTQEEDTKNTKTDDNVGEDGDDDAQGPAEKPSSTMGSAEEDDNGDDDQSPPLTPSADEDHDNGENQNPHENDEKSSAAPSSTDRENDEVDIPDVEEAIKILRALIAFKELNEEHPLKLEDEDLEHLIEKLDLVNVTTTTMRNKISTLKRMYEKAVENTINILTEEEFELCQRIWGWQWRSLDS